VTLARQGRPHPDPSVILTALAAARAVQRWYEVVLVGALAVLAADVLVFRAFWTLSPAGFDAYLVMLGVMALACVTAVALLGRWGIWPPTAVRIEAAGIRYEVARRPLTPLAPITVATSPRRWRPILVCGALSLIGIVALETATPAPWWAQVARVVCMLLALACGALLGRRTLNAPPPWARRRPRAGSPVLTLDDNGIALPHLGVAMPWPQVADVVVLAVDRAGLALLVWSNAAPPTTVGVPAAWLSLPVEDVVAAARDHVAAARAAASAGN
jgi:hypothetical protein